MNAKICILGYYLPYSCYQKCITRIKKTEASYSMVTSCNYRFSRLSWYGESMKSNRIEMTNDNLFIAILPMTTLSISCQSY